MSTSIFDLLKETKQAGTNIFTLQKELEQLKTDLQSRMSDLEKRTQELEKDVLYYDYDEGTQTLKVFGKKGE